MSPTQRKKVVFITRAGASWLGCGSGAPKERRVVLKPFYLQGVVRKKIVYFDLNLPFP